MKFTQAVMVALVTAVLLGNTTGVSFAQQPSILMHSNPIAQVETTSTVPIIVVDFFETLTNVGARDAFEVWSDSYNLEAAFTSNPAIFTDNVNQDALSPEEMTEAFEELVTVQEVMLDMAAGECSSYTILDSLPLGENTQVIYVVSEHKKIPVFWNFTVYQTEDNIVWNIPNDGWVITNYEFNTDVNEVIPLSVIDQWISKVR
ncbi:hypothetical protein Lepto7375DRAFT_0497 [Leptolyngbya sp. PCC 7375]|nr:hypothetical protein Lepto7375DRAFT_0497 [Leptolyngbya sp. PCC 7375]